jgi:DNA-binding beta-propeller fold protein YncE
MLRIALFVTMLACGLNQLQADQVVLVAGGGEKADDAPATQCKVIQPFACDFLADGSLVFVEMAKGERLRKISPDGHLKTLAGTGKLGKPGEDGPALQATFNGMHNLLVAPDGLIYLADSFNNRVRVYDSKTQTVKPFAGTGMARFSGDGGPALKAEFNQVICIGFDKDAKRMLITDISNRRIRAIEMASGVVSTFAGNGQKGEPKDGELAREQPLIDPRAVAADSKGNVYILERGGHRLRVVNPDGKIKTVAGTGKAGIGGDGGPALKAPLNGPKYLFCDKDDSVLIVDTENHQIRRYIPGQEIIRLVAGTGKKGSGGVGGDPLKLEMARPHGVITHPKTGEIYIADSDNGRIVKITK